MNGKDDAVVLHVRPYGDADGIVSLFCRRHGRIAVYGRGVRSSKRQNAPPLLPLYEVRLELSKKATSDLYSARAVDLVVTELGVIGFPGGVATLLETAPGVTPQQVVEATEANLAMPANIPTMAV